MPVPDLYASAKEETFQTIEYILDNDIDFRELLTTQTSFVDRRLASLYGIPAPSCQMDLVKSHSQNKMGRRGLLTQASMLNLHAHATASSPTLARRLHSEDLALSGRAPSTRRCRHLHPSRYRRSPHHERDSNNTSKILPARAVTR